MAETMPRYLTGRSYDEGELAFTRGQATFYNEFVRGSHLEHDLVLVPACVQCGSDDLRDDRANLALVCNECGSRNAADVIRAGRLARR